MLRKAFRMSVHRGHEAEYERRHNPVWPELEATLRAQGVRVYSIFLDAETNDLFGYVEVESDARWQAIAATEVCQRWWASMRELMPSQPDNRPISQELREVFRIDPPNDDSRDRATERVSGGILEDTTTSIPAAAPTRQS